MDEWSVWTFAAVAMGLYFFPAIIAFARKHRNRGAIAVLVLLLGWTVMGWIVALVWAFTNNKREAGTTRVNHDASETAPISGVKDCFYCAETIKASAIKCRFCGSDLTQPPSAKSSGIAAEIVRDTPSGVSPAARAWGDLVPPSRWNRLSASGSQFRHLMWAVACVGLLFGLWHYRGEQLHQIAASYLPSDVYPKQLAGHKSFELAELVDTLIPDDRSNDRSGAVDTVVGWGHAETSGVVWLTPGTVFDQTPLENGFYHRVGIVRVHIGPTLVHILREHTQELGWTVDLVGVANPGFGPRVIKIQPGVPDEVCFGSTKDGCTFQAPIEALKKAGFAVKPLCSGEGTQEQIEGFRLSKSGKANTVLLWKNSGGSGGKASWLELELDTRGTAGTFCASNGVTHVLGIAGSVVPPRHPVPEDSSATASHEAQMAGKLAVAAAEAARVAAEGATAEVAHLPPAVPDAPSEKTGRFSHPSFDCGKATLATEHAICNEPNLGHADRLTAALYRSARAKAGQDQPALTAAKAGQRAWLKVRNLCGADLACISQTYDQRVAVLLEQVPETGQSGSSMKTGECVKSLIVGIGPRLMNATMESGVHVTYSGRGTGVSYDEEPEVLRSHVGDAVIVCLEWVPTQCPPGDDRGKVYFAHNLRTRENWSLPDSQHSCGGA